MLWKNATGKWVKTFSILTTTPNKLTARVHDRMPVILDPDKYDLWLDPALTNLNVISELLKPYHARLRQTRVYEIQVGGDGHLSELTIQKSSVTSGSTLIASDCAN